MSATPAPDWAYRTATAADRAAVRLAYEKGLMRTNWMEVENLKRWAKHAGWPAPFFGFQARFYETMLASDAHFALALSQSGLQIRIPVLEHTIAATKLQEWDAIYNSPQDWKWLVFELRELRRAIETGVVIRVEGEELNSFNSFYTWAHGRYPYLEEGVDEWIGMD